MLMRYVHSSNRCSVIASFQMVSSRRITFFLAKGLKYWSCDLICVFSHAPALM